LRDEENVLLVKGTVVGERVEAVGATLP
jgi:hypothetical protein